jgi:ATP/maltotriose-dependent transcriptional regulator MalT
MAWKEGLRLGERSSPKILKSHMHYRSREMNIRSAFPVGEMGKSQKDAWFNPERVYLDRPRSSEDTNTIGESILKTLITPLNFTITNDFLNALSVTERSILEDLVEGFSKKEIAQRNHVTPARLKSLRHDLASKAVEYL